MFKKGRTASWTVLFLVVSGLRAGGTEATVQRDNTRWILANASIARVIETAPFLHTVSVMNRLTEPPSSHTVESRGFVLSLDDNSLQLSAADFHLDTPQAGAYEGGAQLVVPLGCENAESPLRPFTDYYVTACLRGTQMTEVYNNISAWDDAHADAAAAVLKWMVANDDVLLASARFIGGDPLAGEPYGYAHFTREGRGIIVIRNPALEPRTFDVPFDETAGMWPGEKEHVVRIVYPFTLALPEPARNRLPADQGTEASRAGGHRRAPGRAADRYADDRPRVYPAPRGSPPAATLGLGSPQGTRISPPSDEELSQTLSRAFPWRKPASCGGSDRRSSSGPR